MHQPLIAPSFPATRTEALRQLDAFAKHSHHYARERNFIVDDHRNVSRLSAALQHRLITQQEVIDAVLRHHSLTAVEKFVQEVWWRSYWKGWLQMHPGVWANYQQSLRSFSAETITRAENVAAGNSGCAVMDDFARELLTTGYLHNHARMWWASFWIHQQRLPWQLGARHFMQHLLDADAASNTLSWRWVAGLHTVGKTYLVRRDNIERYHHAPPLDGFSMLENVRPQPLSEESPAEKIPYRPLPTSLPPLAGPTALLLHEEDLSIETTVLRDAAPQSIVFFHRSHENDASPRVTWRETAFADGNIRATNHFQQPVTSLHSSEEIVAWLRQQNIRHLLMMAPMVGPLHDALTALPALLHQSQIQLTTLRREEDQRLFPYASSGFFTFWKKASRHLTA